jgi:hypothetical protein
MYIPSISLNLPSSPNLYFLQSPLKLKANFVGHLPLAFLLIYPLSPNQIRVINILLFSSASRLRFLQLGQLHNCLFSFAFSWIRLRQPRTVTSVLVRPRFLAFENYIEH